jgi:quercetin dioxygenase-like cupin family protein
MFIGKEEDIEKIYYNNEHIKDVIKQVAVGPKQGWEGYVMRIFTIKNGGYTARHSHDWPHINYIIEGSGTLHINGKDNPVEQGSVAYVPNNATHQFMANKGTNLKFICIVPEKGEY